MTALLIVRATVPDADRDAFDRWYQEEHLPDAVAAFNASGATRGWSDVEAGVPHDASLAGRYLQSVAVEGIEQAKVTRTMIFAGWGTENHAFR